MFIEYYDAIERSNISSKDKKIFKDFLEALDKYKSEPDKFLGYTNEELKHIFLIAKNSPSLQIKIWQKLPTDIVNNPGNIEIFENVLDNKFGEYINGIDKRALVKMLNGSRTNSRTNG
jgi:hypothetical protein